MNKFLTKNLEKLKNDTIRRTLENLQEPLDKILEVNFINTITKMYLLINRLFNFISICIECVYYSVVL